MTLLLSMVLSANACPSLQEILDRGQEALVDLRTDEVDRALAEAEQALDCGSPPEPDQLGELFLIEGVYATVLGEEERALSAFQALARTSRESWNDVYGAEVRALYERAAEVPAGIGSIELTPKLGSNVAWLDGVEAPRLSNQITGLHVVQVTDHLGAVRFGRIVYLAPDQVLEVQTGVAPGPKVVTPTRTMQKGLLFAGVGTAVAGAGMWGLSLAQNPALEQADSRAKLDRALGTQVGLTAGGAVALAASSYLIVRFLRVNRKSKRAAQSEP